MLFQDFKYGKALRLKFKPQRHQLFLELVYIYIYSGLGNKALYFYYLSHLAMSMVDRDRVAVKAMSTDRTLARYQQDKAM